MSKKQRRSQVRSCRFHRPFPTAESAQVHYVEKVREGRADPGQTVYRCTKCKAWHHGGAGKKSLGRLMEEAQGG